MAVYTYKQILKSAKDCTINVHKNYRLGITTKWGYYFAKAILTPNKDIQKIKFDNAKNPMGTRISRQLRKSEYLDCAKRLVAFVEKNKVLPNYITFKSNHKIRTRLFVLMFAKVLVSYSKNGKLPSEVNVNYKAFTKPVETGNAVYDYFAKVTGMKFNTIDDFLGYIKTHYKYEYYYDDRKSNKQVIDSKSGNCTDLLQMMCNYVEAMGYEWKCIHVKCRVSGAGHVFGKFRKKGITDWFIRDIASVADGGSVISVWCRDGLVLAENPQWWLANLHR